jgi:branched-chain amino acid transport system permease protein
VQAVVAVVMLASVYALLASGIVVIYKSSRVLNFGHGELAVLGGYVALSILSVSGGSLPWSTAGVVATSVASGMAVYYLLMRRMTGQPAYVAILVTIGLAILIKAILLMGWQAQARTIPLGGEKVFALPGGGWIFQIDLATLGLTMAFFAALFVFYRRSRLGRQLLGVAENPLLAALRGVNIHGVLALAWAIAVFAAGLAGVLYGSRTLLSLQSVGVGLSGLTAALVGGLDSLLGAILGAILVALSEYLTIRFIDPIMAEAVPFIVLLLAMILRPWGLLGTPEEIERV